MNKITFLSLLVMLFSVPLMIAQTSLTGPPHGEIQLTSNTGPFQLAPMAITNNFGSTANGGDVACAGSSVTDNLIWTEYDLDGDFGIVADWEVTSVTVGIGPVSVVNPIPLTINIYSNDGTFPGGVFTLQGTAAYALGNADNMTVLTVPVVGTIPAGDNLLYEIFVDGDAGGGTDLMRFAINTDGFLGDSWLQAAACGIVAPTTLAGIGIPGAAWIMSATGDISAPAPACGVGLPLPIDAGAPVTSLATTTVAPGVIGSAVGEYTIDGISFDAQTNWANEVNLTLTSPGGGASIDLSSANGPSGFANMITEFSDGSANDVTTWSSGSMLPDYQAEGGLLNTVFAGQPADGVWDLTVTDNLCCDGGTWNEWCITLTQNPVSPIIMCPSDIMANNTVGQCDAVVNFTDAVAIDPDGGPVTVMQTMGPISGSVFPLGDTIIEFTATDQDGDTSSCQFTITVIDNEAPSSFTCPADQTVDNDPGICGALVTYDNPVVVDNCFTNGGGGGGTYDITINIAEPALMGTNTFSFTGAMSGATTDATLTVMTFGDIDGTGGNEEAWTIFDEDAATTGMIGATGDFADQCVTTLTETFTIPMAMINTWAADGMIDFEGTDVAGNVNISGLCTPESFLQLQLTYDFGAGPGPIPYTVIAGQASGTVFPVGTTTNTLEYTDAGGNTIQCSFDVTVNDVEAPVIICEGEPAPVTGSASASPALAIPDNDPAGISTILTVTDDFAIADLNVDLDIAHTWVGDLIVTLESPAGTSVTVIDQPGVPASGFGCGGNDILASMDDEAATPVEDECDAGVPTINGSFIPNNALDAFDGEMTAGDWILTVSDNAGGDTGTINTFGITYDYLAPSVGIDVFLDANGMATIPASDMIISATDNCGAIVVTAAGGAPLPMTLLTTLAGGNGNFGNMFDVNSLTDVTVDSFDIHGDTGATYDVEVYAKSGTWVGAEGDMSQWTLIGTAPGVVSLGDGVVTPLGLMLGYAMAAGETHAFYVTPTDFSTGGFNYTNGNATGDVFAADANIEFLEGAGIGYPFDDGVLFQPRVWNGNIQYSAGGALSTMIDFTCEDVGVNLIQVFVTDAAGNESTCTATVNVIDDIAPVITCFGGGSGGSTDIMVNGSFETGDFTGWTVQDFAAPFSPYAVGPIADTGFFTAVTPTDGAQLAWNGFDSGSADTSVVYQDVSIPSGAVAATLSWDENLDYDLDTFCTGCSARIYEVQIRDLSDNVLEVVQSVTATPNTIDNDSLWESLTADLAAYAGQTVRIAYWQNTPDASSGPGQFALDNVVLDVTTGGSPPYIIELGPDGTAEVEELLLLDSIIEACGISTSASDITEVTCADIGTPLMITVFVSDPSGNIAACVATVIVVDLLGPEVTCPADQTIDPGPGNLFYPLPDYFALGEATATDNCTDPVTVFSQTPPVGTLLGDGTYTIECSATDEYGNVGTCTFELTVESVLGTNDNVFSNAIVMYPNPANEQVIISNSSNIALERVMMFDVVGKLVSNIDMRGTQGENVIDISNLQSGVYMVQIQGENASVTKRLIKE